MKGCVLVFVALSALGTATSWGADLAPRYAKAPAPIMSPVYDWSGFYVGANAGYGWHDRDVSFSPNDIIAALGVGPQPPVSLRAAGAVGGVQFGYNWQFNRNLLLGIEADFQWSDIKGSGTSTFANANSSFLQSANEQTKWFGTVRGRLGYIFANNLLAYVTGGIAYGRVEQNLQIDKTNPGGFEFVNNGFHLACFPPIPCYAGSSARTAAGWTAGGGLEYPILDRWSLKAEYLFVDLGDNNFVEQASRGTRPPPGTLPSSYTAHFSDPLHVVRIGLNYRFGNGPIVARY